MKTFKGFLFAKLERIGTRSEGPEYYLQFLGENADTKDFHIQKQSELWKIDPQLHPFLAQKVTIKGDIKDSIIQYEEITTVASSQTEPVNPLQLNLKLEGDSYDESQQLLWINRMSSPITPPPPVPKVLLIKLQYKTPGEDNFRGECPSTQFFEFIIKDPDGNSIWKWSNSLMFLQRQSGFELRGNQEYEFPVEWHYFTNAITNAGKYTVVASFLATGQEVSKILEIKFAI
jgi:hypothetical protein